MLGACEWGLPKSPQPQNYSGLSARQDGAPKEGTSSMRATQNHNGINLRPNFLGSQSGPISGCRTDRIRSYSFGVARGVNGIGDPRSFASGTRVSHDRSKLLLHETLSRDNPPFALEYRYYSKKTVDGYYASKGRQLTRGISRWLIFLFIAYLYDGISFEKVSLLNHSHV